MAANHLPSDDALNYRPERYDWPFGTTTQFEHSNGQVATPSCSVVERYSHWFCSQLTLRGSILTFSIPVFTQ